jgi:HlyD family secretion protein
MDIPRESEARERRRRRLLYALIAGMAVLASTLGLSRLRPAAPAVDRATVWVDAVKRGPMVREVRGLGKLVPERISWIPAATDGRVVKRLVLPGTPLKPDTVILEMENPELAQSLADAEYQLKAAQADYDSLKVKLDAELLDQRSNSARVASESRQAALQAEINQKLAAAGLLSNLALQLSQTKAEQLALQQEIEQKRLSIHTDSARAQLAAQQAKLSQLRALYELKRSQVDELRVRAGMIGVLQLLEAEVGQRVTAGTNLARVSDPTVLKAEIRIPETQAKDVQLGQTASIDTHNGIVAGHVSRIDPSAVNATVTVDVALDEPLPSGARPDLSVEGTVTIERLRDVIYVGRPAMGQAESKTTLFKLVPNSKEAVRVPVTLGRASVSTIEVRQGLKPGDEVILSDMSAWDGFDRIRLP